MSLKLRKESALNLTLKGSCGNFNVGAGRDDQKTLPVKFFLTHVSLDFESGFDEALLNALSPVREIFDFETLDFNEIMQRDIDDARVSSELVPYLLDEKSRDLIKLFPPIIVTVLPVKEGENRPANYYPAVSIEPEEIDGQAYEITRSGEVSKEVFEFRQPKTGDETLSHDLVRFCINTHKSRLIIVDGQHRAMALLALYRNLRDKWSDEKRAPFKDYYAEWTPNFIQKFNLKEINLPVMLCTFPSLDENYKGDFDLKKASRSIFLTLNKTARSVSTSRNRLLDDHDLLALFLRRCLSVIKSRDARSPRSMRIFNVELDQLGDKAKLTSDVAVTGVNHIYYILEHLLLDSGDVIGCKPRGGKFYKRSTLDDCLDRLQGRDVLGAEIAEKIRRDNFTSDSAEKLGGIFDKEYGASVLKCYEGFELFECNNKAALWLESDIASNKDRQLRPILFEGQGIGRVFETHRTNLKQRLQEGAFTTDVPKVEATVASLDATAKRIAEAIESFKEKRTENCLSAVSNKADLRGDNGKTLPEVISWYNEFFDNVVTTVAFQAGMICGFWGEIERANASRDKEGKGKISSLLILEDYLDQLNSWFIPKSAAHFKRLVRVFRGDLKGAVAEWEIIESNRTFRSVVYRGEMQPDQWPKYKYLFLEIWEPKDETVAAMVNSELKVCRAQIFRSLYDSKKDQFCRDNLKPEEDLTVDELRKVFKDTYDSYSALLKNIETDPLDKKAMESLIASAPDDQQPVDSDE
ncbi:MAG: DNA sulfur modification protein DndB [Verrucomicrobiales bacterium]|nr:DNA sulfur modification protein DndB [Verrucomicrobiales bacterium]